MTKKTKQILGVVAVLGVAYYLYDRSKKMKEVSELKAGAETVVEETVELPTPIINKEKTVDTFLQQKELNFAGSTKGVKAQYFR